MRRTDFFLFVVRYGTDWSFGGLGIGVFAAGSVRWLARELGL